MGLASYGQPKYVQLIYGNLIDLKPDGAFRLEVHMVEYLKEFWLFLRQRKKFWLHLSSSLWSLSAPF